MVAGRGVEGGAEAEGAEGVAGFEYPVDPSFLCPQLVSSSLPPSSSLNSFLPLGRPSQDAWGPQLWNLADSGSPPQKHSHSYTHKFDGL